jgi:hypothetical protein
MSKKRGYIHPLPHTPLWRNAQSFTHRDKFSYLAFLCRVLKRVTGLKREERKQKEDGWTKMSLATYEDGRDT